MALKKPLVISSGLIQQLQAGDSIASVETGQVTLTADSDLIAGSPVYATTADHVDKGQANATGTSQIVGITTAAIANTASGQVQTNGVVTLTTTQWDAVAGTTGGLAPNTPYFLNPDTAGLMTATAPTTVGETVVFLGVALSTTELSLNIRDYILL